MKLISSKRSLLMIPFVLAACSTTVADKYTATTAGFGAVTDAANKAIGKETVWTQSQQQSQDLSKRVHGLVYKKTISAETAVQVALLNNKGLQAAYAEVGISAAEVWQEALPENPVISLGIFGLGAPELGVFRSIEGTFATNLLDAKTRKQRVALADIQFQQAQLSAVNETLQLAAETRQAWIVAVSAFEALGNLKLATHTADASSKLAQNLGEAGSLDKGGQAREHAFYAELAGKTAKARLEAETAKEQLTRLMGLWGTDVDYYVPNALPKLPKTIARRKSIETIALQNRFDLKVAKLGLEATAKAFGMTDASRYVTDLELIAGFETERESDGGSAASNTTPQLELEFAIPIFDTGQARLRKAELTYLRAANVLAEMAVGVRSEARGAEAAYHGSYEIARHYRDTVVPLRKVVEEAALLSNNGMITNTFELLEDTRETLDAQLEAGDAKRDFWLAKANLTAAIYGGATSLNRSNDDE
jgi:outer membrane protein TolC